MNKILKDKQEERERERIRTAKKCEWKYDLENFAFDTSCDGNFSFITDGIKENGFKYCPYCAKPIEGDE